jgi:flagellar basal-body rod protein FlgC
MSFEAIMGIANSALTAQTQRLTLIAQNLANADSVLSPDGGPYQRRVPVFASTPIADGAADGDGAALGVRVAAVARDQTPPGAVYDPSNP